jgi:hypothetical protein
MLCKPPEEERGDLMRIPPMGYLTLALLCGELACVVAWAFTGIFSVLAALRWRD